MRRLALRNLRSDEGLSLVETVVALMVFGLIMTGLAGSMAMLAHSATLSRARASATTLAQQLVEKARAISATVVDNCDSTTGVTPYPPSTSPYRGAGSYTVAQGNDSNCIAYKKAFTQDGISFTVTRLVLLAAPPTNDVAGQLQTEKYLVVQVAWTDAGGATKTYELDTIINQKGSNAAPPVQGIRILVEDINSPANIIASDNANWAVEIRDSGGNLVTDPDATSAEGAYSQVDLTPGTYSCKVTTTDDGSAGYYPASATYNPSPLSMPLSNDTVTGPCVVQAGLVTDFITKWTSFPDCSTSGSGTVSMSVYQPDGVTPVPTNMALAITNVNTGQQYTSTAVSHSFGLAAGWYTYSVTDPTGTWQTAQSSYGPVCVTNKVVQTIAVTMTALENCAPGTTTNATLSITVVDDNTTPATTLSGFKVTATDTSVSPNTVTNFKNTTNSNGISTQAGLKPGLYTVTVTPPSGSSYQGSGIQGPFCVAANNIASKTIVVDTKTCTRDTGSTGSMAFYVTDQTGKALSGASIKVTNVNGDQTVAAVTTDTTGHKTISNLKVDPWQYVVTGPGGNYLSSGVLGPLCVLKNAVTNVPTVALDGLMNVVVTVRNNDSLPWKNYQVTLTDGAGNTTTQYVTVPNCQPAGTNSCPTNPSKALTFSGLKTGSGYVVQANAQLKADHFNLVDTAPADLTTTFNFPAPLQTYTASMTGYGELALVDDTGGN